MDNEVGLPAEPDSRQKVKQAQSVRSFNVPVRYSLFRKKGHFLKNTYASPRETKMDDITYSRGRWIRQGKTNFLIGNDLRLFKYDHPRKHVGNSPKTTQGNDFTVRLFKHDHPRKYIENSAKLQWSSGIGGVTRPLAGRYL